MGIDTLKRFEILEDSKFDKVVKNKTVKYKINSLNMTVIYIINKLKW